MSDHSISIVPCRSIYPYREQKAKEILDWLILRDIVQPTPSDCVLSSNSGYALSMGAKAISTNPDLLPFDLNTNGLEIITERQVFDTGENGLEKLICPNCRQDISSEDWDFLNEWSENNTNDISCPLCNTASDIHRFAFTPQWGFSDLGFTFWNWGELSDQFIWDFKQKLNCDVDVVLTWI